MNVLLILDFGSAEEAASALQRITGTGARAVIDPKDNPEYGAHVRVERNAAGAPIAVPLPPQAALPVAVPPAQPEQSLGLLSSVGFGQGVTLPAGAIPAPASAVAAPNTTVPAVPSGTTAVPPVPTASAQQPGAAAVVPTAPVGQQTFAPAGVTLDTGGLPWDARIHASTKTFNRDGTWRQKRELDPALKTQVEAELRSVLAANAVAAGQVAAAGNALAANGVTIPPVAAPVAQPQSTATVVPTPPIPAPAPAEASTASPSDFKWTFSALAERLTPLMMTSPPTISQEQVAAVLAKHGLKAFGQMALAPDTIPLIANDLGLQP